VWHVNTVDCCAKYCCVMEVWHADARCMAQTLGMLHRLEGPLDLQSIFTSDDGGKPALGQLKLPFFSVAKSDVVIQVP